MMKVIDVPGDAKLLSPAIKKEVQQVLKNNQVLVYPTDTLYGLGVDACSEEAVAELYRLKKRQSAPVSVLLESSTQLLAITEGLSGLARQMIDEFLPGPLTVICRSTYPFAQQLVSNKGTVGFRVPGDPISCQIPLLFGGPITTTSVNPAQALPASAQQEVSQYYEDSVALMLNIGPMKRSKGSTVIDLTTTPFKILREGEISRHALRKYLN